MNKNGYLSTIFNNEWKKSEHTCSLVVSEGRSTSPHEGVSSGVVHVEMRPASEPRLSEDISGGSCDPALFLKGLPTGRTVPCGGGAGTLKLFRGWPCIRLPSVFVSPLLVDANTLVNKKHRLGSHFKAIIQKNMHFSSHINARF